MIDRIVIDNFKSIKHADVKLQKINLLIGPNNSGKSNFLKGIMHTYFSFRYDSSYLSFHVNNNNQDQERTDISIWFNTDYQITTKDQEIDVTDELAYYVHDFNERRKSESQLFSLLESIKIYKPDLGKLHHPYPIFQNDDTVLEDASNIASFLQTCLNKHRKYFNTITEELKKVLPVFDEIIIENVEPEEVVDKKGNKQITTDVPKIKLGFRDIGNRVIWAEDLSEGALYFLALLCIIHQPTPPKLLLLEEPERSIHPRRIKEVIDLIRQLSEEKDIQVIMTTHSPLVVDLFENEPESIHVFEMQDGFTEIKNLKTDILDPINKELEESGIEPHKDYDTTLGQQWVYGFLGGVPV